MRLRHFLPVLAATGAFAFNLHNVLLRDASESSTHRLTKRLSSLAQLAVTDLHNFTTITNNITTQIKNFTDVNGALRIQTTTNDLIAALAKGTHDMTSDPANLTNTDALQLGAPTQFLAYAANASIANLIIKKDLFAHLGLTTLVINSLNQQIAASANFSTALIAKIPANLQPISNALNAQVGDSLAMGVACFQNKNASCNTAVVNSSRTFDQAAGDGSLAQNGISTSGASGMEMGGLLTLVGAAVVGVLFAA